MLKQSVVIVAVIVGEKTKELSAYLVLYMMLYSLELITHFLHGNSKRADTIIGPICEMRTARFREVK